MKNHRGKWIDVKIVHNAKNGEITVTVCGKTRKYQDNKQASNFGFKWGPYSLNEKTKDKRPLTVKYRDISLNIQ